MRVLVLILALIGCGPGAGPYMAMSGANLAASATNPDLSARGRIAAECQMLEAAQAETRARGLTAWPDVLAGCPGHPATGTMSLRQMSDATRAANAATLPAAARPLGPRADLIFRRMITRGVPVPVAQAMTATPNFANATR